ncbi:MAG: GNAT family N-acetyltransferase [Nitrososphaerales archaeon]
MISENFSRYQKMLANERSFDKLFSDEYKGNNFLFYYNKAFSDDPIFNHAVPAEDTLDSTEVPEDLIEDIFESVKSKAREFDVPASVFLEEFRANVRRFETTGIESGYRVIEKMDALSKDLVSSIVDNPFEEISVEETRDAETWIDIFMRSFAISQSWKEELQQRGSRLTSDACTTLLLASEPKASANISGCLLLHVFPAGCGGIYCVGTIPERRHRGVANALMRKAESLAKEKNCQFTVLQTVNSDGVTPMYLKLGYLVNFERVVMQSEL